MQHEFKFAGEMIEVTIARDSENWMLGENRAQVLADGRILVTSTDGTSKFAHSAKVGDVWWIHFDGHIFCIEKSEAGSSNSDSDEGMTAPMPGKILEVKVADGESVESGQLLLIMEAMKMEHRIQAPKAGEVLTVNFAEGDRVDMGATLVELGE